jgi:hypothetical protein
VIVVSEGLDVVVDPSSTADPEDAGLIAAWHQDHQDLDSPLNEFFENVIAGSHDDL